MTSSRLISDDRLAMVAACTTLGLLQGSRGRGDVLSNQEWNQLSQWLGNQRMRPADLLYTGASDLNLEKLDPRIGLKVSAIAERASVVALEIEHLEIDGIWALSRMDEEYPQLWKSRLKSAAPPVIFGSGPKDLMDQPSVAIVGSREITPKLEEIGTELGRRVVEIGNVVISGGARGSDRVGMDGAFQAEGCAVGVLPADLAKISRRHWDQIASERLCFVTQVNPAAGFSVGNAMGRNRLIYALSDLTIVIATASGSGGTWAGATQNLKQRWAPLAVWTGAGAPPANHELVALGAFPVDVVPEARIDMRALVQHAASHHEMWEPQTENPVGIQLGFTLRNN